MAGKQGMRQRHSTEERRRHVLDLVQMYGLADPKLLADKCRERLGYPVKKEQVKLDLKVLYGHNNDWVNESTKQTWLVKIQQMLGETNEEVRVLQDIKKKIETATKVNPAGLYELVESLPEHNEAATEQKRRLRMELTELVMGAEAREAAPTVAMLTRTIKDMRVFLTELMSNKPLYEHVRDMAKQFELIRKKEAPLAKRFGP